MPAFQPQPQSWPSTVATPSEPGGVAAISDGAIADRVTELGRELLRVQAGPDRELFDRLPCCGRIDIDGHRLRRDGVEATDPGGLTLGLETERKIDTDAQPHIRLRHVPGAIEIHQRRGLVHRAAVATDGVAQVACGAERTCRRADTGADVRRTRAGVAKFGSGIDAVPRPDELPLAREPRQAGGIEVDRAGIFGQRRLAGVDGAEAAGVLLHGLKAGRNSRAGECER